MAVKLLKASQFLGDYREIALYLFEANADAAEKLCNTVEATTELLIQHPQLGMKTGVKRAPDVRRWVLRAFPNYVIYYREPEEGIVLLRLLHGARLAAPQIPNT